MQGVKGSLRTRFVRPLYLRENSSFSIAAEPKRARLRLQEDLIAQSTRRHHDCAARILPRHKRDAAVLAVTLSAGPLSFLQPPDYISCLNTLGAYDNIAKPVLLPTNGNTVTLTQRDRCACRFIGQLTAGCIPTFPSKFQTLPKGSECALLSRRSWCA